MHASDSHKVWLRRKFQFPAPPVEFTPEEIRLLERYGGWLYALGAGRIEPETPEQQHFVEVFLFERAAPVTQFEFLWRKYRRAYRSYPWARRASQHPASPYYEPAVNWEIEDEMDLLARELDDDAESFARSREDGWFYT